MKKNIKDFVYQSIGLCMLMALLYACKNSKNDDAEPDSQKVRAAFLQNIGQNYITPKFEALKTYTSALAQASDSLNHTVDLNHLIALQTAYEQAYMKFLELDAFRFGAFKDPAFNLSLHDYVATMPCSTAFIESKIKNHIFNTGDYHFSTRGFATLDYLLYDHDGVQDSVLNRISKSDRRVYLHKNCLYIDSIVGLFHRSWKSSAGEFANDASLNPNSTLNQLFNSFLMSYEFAMDNKVKMPAGLDASNVGVTAPEKVEAYFSGKSKAYLRQHVASLYEIWKGETQNNSNAGFDDLIVTQVQDSILVKTIFQAFDKVLTSIDALPQERLDVLIVNNNTSLRDVFNNMVELNKHLRTETASILSLSLTYNSNDGD